MRIFAKLCRVFLTTFKANTANINIESSHQNRITMQQWPETNRKLSL